MKRMFDVVVAAVALVLLSPVLVIVAIAVRATSRGPALYRADRVGMGGRPFVLYKFRSMTVGSRGAAITRAGDDRVTRLGRWLRRIKLDELPQLLNVLKGDMSLVGPRPEDPRFVALYTEEQREVLTVRPGMTSPTAVAYRHEEAMLEQVEEVERFYADQVLPAKLAMDLEYVRASSLGSDIVILFRTLRSILSRSS
jgi:lipopolysaccharide/colanic/teichoic acid biosynthesis glycosyltransferase